MCLSLPVTVIPKICILQQIMKKSSWSGGIGEFFKNIIRTVIAVESLNFVYPFGMT